MEFLVDCYWSSKTVFLVAGQRPNVTANELLKPTVALMDRVRRFTAMGSESSFQANKPKTKVTCLGEGDLECKSLVRD